MMTPTRESYPWLFRTTLVGLLAAGPAAWGQTTLSSGHADIGIAYELGSWDLHVHQEDPPPGAEYAPDEAILEVGAAAQTVVPAGAAFSFLGTPGDPLWILPKTQVPSLLFLGIGAEELDPGDWSGNLTLSLSAVSGPGQFLVWDTDSFGQPTVLMNSRDGVTGADQLTVIPGSHGHYFMGFTAPGNYTVSFDAAGTHLVDGASSSGPVAYEFAVVPEPSVGALLAVGAATVLALRRRGRAA